MNENQPKNVLLIVDDPSDIDMLTLAFTTYGKERAIVTAISDLEKDQHLLQAHVFDVVILDQFLREIQGIDLFNQISPKHEGIKGILLAHNLNPEDSKRAQKSGLNVVDKLAPYALQQTVKIAISPNQTDQFSHQGIPDTGHPQAA